uniref:AAA+ ATPase domain-containing protein n=1 Tax=viral metagenome TaxID=1070528 RepID=A0A6C0M0Z8_9ZZZZ
MLGFETLVSTIATSTISRWLKLDHSYYGLLYSTISEGMSHVNGTEMYTRITSERVGSEYTYVGVLIAVPLLVWACVKYRAMFALLIERMVRRKSIKIYSVSTEYTYLRIKEYLSAQGHNPNLIVITGNHEVGNYNVGSVSYTDIGYSKYMKQSTTFTASWYHETISVTTMKDDKTSVVPTERSYVVLSAHSDVDLDHYVHYIKSIETCHGSTIKTVSYVGNFRSTDTILYTPENDLTPERAKAKYIDTFFHRDRDTIWRSVCNTHYYPNRYMKHTQVPSCNMLLYGPPGTGKSSFIYRMVKATNRNIVILDVTDMTKASLTMVMNRPLSSSMDVGPNCPSNVVFVFDEFDTMIDTLIKTEATRHRTEDAMLERLTTKDTVLPKDVLSEKVIVTLKDLLGIFQGVVPMNGLMIMATTNNIDHIRSKCPALIRPGRLTPVEFDYPNGVVMDQISQHFFGESVSSRLQSTSPDYERFCIPTSQIVELAVACESICDTLQESYDVYVRELRQMLSSL